MQFSVYKNSGRVKIYPFVLDAQSDIIGRRKTRVAIPLFPLKNYEGARADRLNPIVLVAGDEYVLMTHELASVPETVLREEVENIANQRSAIKAAIDFLFDGI